MLLWKQRLKQSAGFQAIFLNNNIIAVAVNVLIGLNGKNAHYFAV